MSADIDPAEFASRLEAVAGAAAEQGVDAVLVTPGADMDYLCGYHAVALERLTCLVVRASGDVAIVVPDLEVLAAQASPIPQLGIEIRGWAETASPHQTVAGLVGKAQRINVVPQMWAAHVFALQKSLPVTRFAADGIVAAARMRKSPWEVQALREAGAAIDRVHNQVAGLLRPGRTEREVGQDISELILAAGHATVDFVIVASGPNGASPHHDVSDRVIEVGDPIVVDIGGTMPSGYCSDSTRTYVVGVPHQGYIEAYEVLQRAQAAAVAHAGPGVTCESVDAAARDVLAAAGLGESFIHRTGHGIGMSTHEEPYIVSGNALMLEPGMAFSIEPGFYLPGKYGARIEDIVIATEDGVINCNNTSHDLVLIDV